ncbi:sulfite exporter TauE/SafE family protein [Leifsonia sp. Root112D2]|uniref:sulfite exporter TauE/SafE family protein n=1 Tax=Leifsonia sp. Root112D2 TaxID=1736426 RepID=UPI0006FA7C9F|nr:sulfite exporter TauE/SafE family protein [Leifsonia sp. Root112D2]KQV06968.1 hypothetical protein ASC63_06355 [Leifsonia sp. Root112D2]
MPLLLLACIGLVAGIGITAVGPGGVLATIGLFLFTGLSPAVVAGTAMVTHVATGTVGSLAYLRSGHLRERQTVRVAVILLVTAIVGTPIGVLLNSTVSGRGFGMLLAGFVLIVAMLVWYRQRHTADDGLHPRHPTPALIAIGLVVAVASGMFGVGGPLLTVPLLVAIGTPILPALAAAQAQSIVISIVGSVGYLSIGAIDWQLALVVGVPELCGVLIGWKVARAVPARYLRWAMIFILIAVAPVLAFKP